MSWGEPRTSPPRTVEQVHTRALEAELVALRVERDRLRTALSDLTQWIIGSDCYKHLPDSVVKNARKVLAARVVLGLPEDQET